MPLNPKMKNWQTEKSGESHSANDDFGIFGITFEAGFLKNLIVAFTLSHGLSHFVIMGTYGHGKLAQTLMGSVAHGVISKCLKSVLVVRLPETLN